MAGATVRWRRPTRPGSRAAPLIRAVPHVDRAGRGGSAESGARRARLLRRRWLLSGVCVCTAATFSVRSRTPRSTRSPACAGWRSRECVDSTNLALKRHLNARHGPRETSNRAWAGVGAVLVHGLLARPPINSRSIDRSWLRSRPVPAGLCLGAAGQRPRTGRLRGSLPSRRQLRGGRLRTAIGRPKPA